MVLVVVVCNTYAIHGKVGCHVTKRCCGEPLLLLLFFVVVLPTQVVTSMRLANRCAQDESFELGIDAGGTKIRWTCKENDMF
jgi:hypothetical protein